MAKSLTLSKHQLPMAAVWCVMSAVALGQDVTPTQQFAQIVPAGVGALTNGPAAPPTTVLDRKSEIRAQDLDALTQLPRIASAALRTLTFPNVTNNAISSSPNTNLSIDGLNHADQRLAGTGKFTNTQFSVEPPDQGLCIGNGFVVEAVNSALAVYRRDNGLRVSGPTALNQFFALQPGVIRSTPPVFGDFISDPRCFFDSQTSRFFLTILQISVDPATGNFLADTSVLIAVSRSADPTGSWNLFRLKTTFDGVGCPCFGDQPLIGFDANGLYISTNAFSLVTGQFAGSQIYATSKLFLASGALPPFVLHFGLPADFNADGSLDFSVHPAVNTRGQEQTHFGAEYFLSSFDITSQLNNKIVVWALQNTALLNSPPGPATKFRLSRKAIPSEVYGVPPDAFQKRGTLPLGSLVNPDVFEILATNEHRMQDVTFSDGNLWSAVTTGLTSPGEDLKAGIAWFSVEVEIDGDQNNLQAEVQRQGYVAAANASVFFPAVGVNPSGNVAIGFSISGPNLFPSTGYVTIGGNGRAGPIHIAGAGFNSEDGFSGYPAVSPAPPPCDGAGHCEARWGDYGAAAVDEDGSIWLANEYIGPRPRTLLANWGTFLIRLKPWDNGSGDN
jgi:hypothetical protein